MSEVKVTKLLSVEVSAEMPVVALIALIAVVIADKSVVAVIIIFPLATPFKLKLIVPASERVCNFAFVSATALTPVCSLTAFTREAIVSALSLAA